MALYIIMFMRALVLGIAAAVSSFAQVEPPIGILRGELVLARAATFEMRTSDKVVYKCGFDFRTYFERENQRITASNITIGETMEVVADHQPGSNTCYARTVHVIDPTLKSRRWRPAPSPTESFAPRGDLTFSGLVMRQDSQSVTVKTRTGDVMLMKRLDTRYFDGGQRVDTATVNSRVFIRAGRNLDGDLEAYQVVWGDILKD